MRCEMSERPLSGCLEDALEEAETGWRPGVWERGWGENPLGKDEAWPFGVGGQKRGQSGESQGQEGWEGLRLMGCEEVRERTAPRGLTP